MKDLMKIMRSGLLVVAVVVAGGLTLGCAEDSDTAEDAGTEAATEEGGEAAEEGGEAAEEGGEAAEEGGEAAEECCEAAEDGSE